MSHTINSLILMDDGEIIYAPLKKLKSDINKVKKYCDLYSPFEKKKKLYYKDNPKLSYSEFIRIELYLSTLENVVKLLSEKKKNRQIDLYEN